MLRPSVLIRRKAMRAGFLGPSTLWKVVGVIVFGKSTIKKVFGRNPEVIDVSALGPGRFMQVTTEKPTTRRRRRKAARAGSPPVTIDQRRAMAREWVGSRSRPAS
jgi:hypothetical protein